MDPPRRDARAERTRAALIDAFNALVLARPYDTWTVADVLAQAGVSRSTFYVHFRSKDDLLVQSASGLLSCLARAVEAESDDGLLMAVKHVWEHRTMARTLLRGPAFRPLQAHLASQVVGRLPKRLTGGLSRVLAADQIAASQLWTIRSWLEGVEVSSAARVAELIARTSRAQREALCVSSRGSAGR